MGRLSKVEKLQRELNRPSPEQQKIIDAQECLDRQAAAIVKYGLKPREVQALIDGDESMVDVLAVRLKGKTYRKERLPVKKTPIIARELAHELYVRRDYLNHLLQIQRDREGDYHKGQRAPFRVVAA